MANPQDIGVRMKQLRVAKGWKAVKAAMLLNVETNVLYHWEAGLHYPKYLNLLEISNLYGVTLEYLAGREAE